VVQYLADDFPGVRLHYDHPEFHQVPVRFATVQTIEKNPYLQRLLTVRMTKPIFAATCVVWMALSSCVFKQTGEEETSKSGTTATGRFTPADSLFHIRSEEHTSELQS